MSEETYASKLIDGEEDFGEFIHNGPGDPGSREVEEWLETAKELHARLGDMIHAVEACDPEPEERPVEKKFSYVGLDEFSRGLFSWPGIDRPFVDVDGELYSTTDEGEPCDPSNVKTPEVVDGKVVS
jgi:hypothetical protein